MSTSVLKRSRNAARLLFACLLLASLACAISLPQAPQPTLPASLPTVVAATPAPFGGTPVSLEGSSFPEQSDFAPYVLTSPEYIAAPPRYTFALDEVANEEALQQLSAAQQEALSERGFVVGPPAFSSFLAAYQQAAEQEIPLFITTDAAFHAVHLLGNVAWRRAQSEQLGEDLRVLSENLVAASLEQWQATSDEAVAAAAWRNLAFFSVGSRLLDPTFAVPPPVQQLVEEELTLISSGGTFLSPLSGRQHDYDRYLSAASVPGQPPGLASFYQAMHWYSQPLLLRDENVASARRTARQVMLMGAALEESQNFTRWQRIYQPTAYFEGVGDGWSLHEARQTAQLVFGGWPPAADRLEQQQVDDFLATIWTLPPASPFAAAQPDSLRFMPAAGQPDRAVFQPLLFNQVGAYLGSAVAIPFTAVDSAIGPIRGLPRGLDLAAALGSERALMRLQSDGDTAYEGYDGQLASLQARLANLDETAWTESLATGLLFAGQPLLTDAEGEVLPFMDDASWQEKEFNGWYGAWTNLRRQPLLAPRPPSLEAVSATMLAGYAEPQPVVFARLAALVIQMREGLQRYGLLEEEAGQKLLAAHRWLEALQIVATKELGSEPLTADEALFMRQAGARMSALLTFAAQPPSSALLVDVPLAALVEVYRDPASGQALQAGLGEVAPLYVLIPGAEQPYLAMGAIPTTYELKHRPGEEVAVWQQADERPEPPPWISSLIVR